MTRNGESPAEKPKGSALSQRRPGNRNSITSGTYSFLVTGRLPRGCSHITRITGRLRRAAEAATTERHGKLSLMHRCLIQAAGRHESRALLLQRLMRVKAETLTPEQQVSILRDISTATDSRDRALAKLGLGGSDTPEILAILYGTSNPAAAQVVDATHPDGDT
jgi:hypothetical protein